MRRTSHPAAHLAPLAPCEAPVNGGDPFDRFWAALDAVPVASDAEALYDGTTAAGRLRRANLATYLDTVGRTASMLLVAEAPGWRGMTNTGVPFTSMRELGPEYLVPPEPTAPWEASSRVVQAVLAEWSGPLPVAWAVFPHHPLAAPDRLTNRTPRPAEVRAGAPVALALLDALRTLRTDARPNADGGMESAVRVVAVGRKAQGALALAGIDAVAVRHPAQGGAAQFTAEMRALRDASG
ncbi:uracil-DNA glycosylase [Curtobacterium luteum]|uniref:uracil-DNA glycosylase n=1 Tax=Curtobacterium luteum TaxID=33881 RepID=UPI0037F516E4